MSEIRSVSVHLDADVAGYIAKMRLAGAETDKAFSRSTKGITATNTSLSKTETQLGKVTTAERRLGTEVDSTSNKLRQGSKDIDRYGGRLGILGDAVLGLGPALVPLGTTAVAGVVGLSQALGFTVLGVGSVVVAFKGFGAELKAVNAAALDPTVENLSKARIAMQNAGPAGRQLIGTIRGLGDEWHRIQQTGQAALFPGIEAGINSLEKRIPEIERIISVTDGEIGHLAAKAGAELSSQKWTPFFNFLEGDAARILNQTGRTVGNLAHATANLFVGLSPVGNGVSAGLLHFSQDIDRASNNLDQSQGFQEFLSYVETNGPRTVDTLGKIGGAFLQIGEAASPLGGPTLTVLGDVASIVARIADSDFGTPLLVGLTALRLFSRTQQLMGTGAARSFGQILTGQKSVDTGYAKLSVRAKTFGSDLVATARYGKLATDQSARLGSQLKTVGRGVALAGALAIASTGAADKVGLTNTASLTLAGSLAGPLGAAAGGAIGFTIDLAHANDDLATSMTNAQAVLSTGSYAQQKAQLDQLRASTTAYTNEVHDAWTPGGSGGLVSQLRQGVTAIGDLFTHTGEKAGAQIDYMSRHLETLRHNTGGLGDLFAAEMGQTSHALDIATSSEQQFAGEFQHMSNVLAGRASFRDYRAAIDAVTEALKRNGQTLSSFTDKGRANQTILDNIANTGIAIAKTFHGQARVDFLGRLRQRLVDTNKTFGASKDAAQHYVDQFKVLNHLHAKPKVDPPDTKPAKHALDDVTNKAHKVAGLDPQFMVGINQGSKVKTLGDFKTLYEASDLLDRKNPTVQVKAETANALRMLQQFSAELNSLHDKTVTLTTVRATGGHSVGGNADGGTIAGPRRPYGDKVLRFLAPGEEVISNRYGQADRHRPLLKRINAGAMADGGTVIGMAGGGTVTTTATQSPDQRLVKGINGELHHLQVELKASTALLTKERQQRDAVVQQRQQLVSTVRSNFQSDFFGVTPDTGIWAAGAGNSTDPRHILRQDIRNARAYGRDIRRLQKRGLRGSALAQVTTLEDAQQALGFSAKEDRQITNLYRLRARAAQAAGATAGDLRFGKQIAEQTAIVKAQAADVHHLNQQARETNHRLAAIEKATKHDGPKATAAAINRPAATATRRARGSSR